MIPFRAWELYFEPNLYTQGGSLTRLLFGLIDHFRTNPVPDQERVREEGWVSVRLRDLAGIQDVERMYEDEPEVLIKLVGLAVCEVVHERELVIRPVHARLMSDGPSTPFQDLKAALVGKFVRVRGSVTRVSSIKPRLTQIAFFCQKCLGRSIHRQPDGVYRIPPKCPLNGCGAAGSKFLVPDRSDAATTSCAWQQVRLQESKCDLDDGGDGDDAGRVPRSMDVELEGSLVDSLAPGDTVTIGAIVKAADLSEGKAHVSPTYVVFLAANWVERERDQAEQRISDDQVIDLISRIPSKDLLPLLVQSFCPQIYGHTLVKLGLLLTLFGGSQHRRQPGSEGIPVRTDAHMLVVGDPGLGKSQLITAAAAIAPRGIYVCGNTSTATGLTATLHHDGSAGGGAGLGGSGYVLEAGAMVLADRGVCCIDEFDKMGEQHRALLQVMEQQQVSIAKAGVVCSLPARTSVIAAANPIGGHYNRMKGLLANLKMDPALLSRFDLVFVLLDRPDAEMDRMLSDRVLGNFSKSSGGVKLVGSIPDPAIGQDFSLLGRLSKKIDHPHLTPTELRRFLAFTRSHIHPRLTPPASHLLTTFYLSLRARDRAGSGDDLLPVTTRHLEAMVRLGEARARMEMRGTVEESDVADVIELMKHCMYDFLQQPDSVSSSTVPSKRKQGSKPALLKRYVAELIRVSSSTGNPIFSETSLREIHTALDIPSTVLSFQECLDALGQYGYVLKRGHGQYKLVVT